MGPWKLIKLRAESARLTELRGHGTSVCERQELIKSQQQCSGFWVPLCQSRGPEFASAKYTIWCEDYFELVANENQQMQKDVFPELPLPNWKQTLQKNGSCHTSFLPGKFYGHEEDRKSALKRMCKNNLYSVSFLYIFTFLQFVALESWQPLSFVLLLLYKCIVLSLRF